MTYRKFRIRKWNNGPGDPPTYEVRGLRGRLFSRWWDHLGQFASSAEAKLRVEELASVPFIAEEWDFDAHGRRKFYGHL